MWKVYRYTVTRLAISMGIALSLGKSADLTYAQTPRSTPTIAPTPTPPPTKKNKCCFCVYPAPGSRDSDNFKDICSQCLPEKFPDCDIYDSIPENAFIPEYIQKYNCEEAINTLNNQHGPDVSQAANIFAVCKNAYPGCSLNVLDVSCSTYESEDKAREAADYYRKSMLEEMKIGSRLEICGSGSTHIWLGCKSYRIVKKFVISPSLVEEKLGLCPPFGSDCRYDLDHGRNFECVDTLGRKRSIPCCKIHNVTDYGYWGDDHGCAGRGCDQKRCPSFNRCRGTSAEWQSCSEVSPTGVCIKGSADCAAYRKTCVQVGKKTDCVAKPTPTPTISSTLG